MTTAILSVKLPNGVSSAHGESRAVASFAANDIRAAMPVLNCFSGTQAWSEATGVLDVLREGKQGTAREAEPNAEKSTAVQSLARAA